MADPTITAEAIAPEPLLELFLAMQVGVLLRDAEGVKQGLRVVATTVEDREGEQFARLLSNSLGPSDRFWLRDLLGPR